MLAAALEAEVDAYVSRLIDEVDEHGLDRLDRGVLDAVVRRFGGGPVGLSTLAVALGEEAETVEVVAEPFLVRCGLLARTPRGRVATAAGWQHLGLTPPPPMAARSRRGHDHCQKLVACWCAVKARLNFGSWSLASATTTHASPTGRMPRSWGILKP